jgi:hypothetical protein
MDDEQLPQGSDSAAQQEAEQAPDNKDKLDYDLFHDNLTRHKEQMHKIIDDPHLSVAGLHAYAQVMHHHMQKALKSKGKLPHWYDPAKEVFNTLGMGKVGQ